MLCNHFNECKERNKLKFNKDGYAIFECSFCHQQYCNIDNDPAKHIAEVYSDSYFFDGKDGYPNYLNEMKILVEHGEWYARKLGKMMKPGKMLDIGAAAGFIMKGFQMSGWDCHGIEPNKNMVDFGRFNLGLNIDQGEIENFNTIEKYDLITLIQVIGHFYDLEKAMHIIGDCTKNDGLVLIECWDRNSIVARLMGKNWHEYSPPTVLRWFTKEILQQIMEGLGFSLIMLGRPLKKISIKHAIALMSEKYRIFKIPFGAIEKIMNHRDFFLIYPPMDLFYAIFKKVS